MSSAHGHRIALMSSGLIIDGKPLSTAYKHAKQMPSLPVRLADGTQVERGPHWVPHCSGLGCENEPVYVTRYLYVTGRPRVTDRIQYWCAECAARWATKRDLSLPPVNP